MGCGVSVAAGVYVPSQKKKSSPLSLYKMQHFLSKNALLIYSHYREMNTSSLLTGSQGSYAVKNFTKHVPPQSSLN